jgi:hypothetical protein
MLTVYNHHCPAWMAAVFDFDIQSTWGDIRIWQWETLKWGPDPIVDEIEAGGGGRTYRRLNIRRRNGLKPDFYPSIRQALLTPPKPTGGLFVPWDACPWIIGLAWHPDPWFWRDGAHEVGWPQAKFEIHVESLRERIFPLTVPPWYERLDTLDVDS